MICKELIVIILKKLLWDQFHLRFHQNPCYRQNVFEYLKHARSKIISCE